MVGPCWIRDKNAHIGIGHMRQFKGLPYRPCPPGRCRCSNCIARKCFSQKKVNHHVGKGDIAHQTNVGFCILHIPKRLFRRFDRPHDRRVSLRILIDTNPKVDFLFPLIVFEHLHQRKNFIRGLFLKGCKH